MDITNSESTTYCLLRSLVEHSYINPKSLAFGYLDEKPIDIGLMKFLGLCTPPPPRPLLRPMLSLHESKGSMTPRKSRLCGTMLPTDVSFHVEEKVLMLHGAKFRSRFGMATNTSSSVYERLREYRILRVSNSPHLCELCTTLSVIT
ncbi:hypothetical protein GW17_00005858 [Ensete ventricosum]|nr:hypothetical protein GW17_00005858 [Ensete ventricosum]